MKKVLSVFLLMFYFTYSKPLENNSNFKYNTNILIIGIPLFLVSLSIDNEVKNIIQNNKNSILNTTTNIFDFFGSKFTYFIPVSVAFLAKHNKNAKLFEASKTAISSSILSTLTVAMLKISINRERPDKSDKNSFPSNHTALAFAVFGSYAHYYTNTKIKYILYTVPTLTAFSRIYKNKHYLSDTIAGAIIGLSSVYFGKYFSKKYLSRFELETNINKNYFSFNLKYNF
ncbi:MAG TPA: phosphatase PAP2 family protein [Persephonella sp.]|nr:phosphatase PAP2 family protein [Hydrogenothermaceae bacterium]HIQ24808.1 phosphatase PAP2 family protein [Persephonella sp.]